MDTESLRRRAHTIAAAVLLSAPGAWLAFVAALGHPVSLIGIALLAAAAGTATLQIWAKWLVYILAVVVVGYWFLLISVDISLSRKFGGTPDLLTSPGFVLVAVATFAAAAYCCYVVHVYIEND